MTASTTEVQPPALEVRGVEAGYGRTTIIRDADLTVPRASVAALLGPNGAGKTTLLKVAAGLLQPTAGKVSVCGRDVTAAAPFKRRHAGLSMIPEGHGIFRNLTVGENLLVQVPRRDRAKAVDRVLSAFPVFKQRLRQVAGTMSGGEQQMLALARCYLNEPEVILVDEVSMGLAPVVVQRVFEAFGRLKQDGVAIVLVEQYVDRALELADAVYVLNRGHLRYVGTPAETDRDDLMHRYLGNRVPTADTAGPSGGSTADPHNQSRSLGRSPVNPVLSPNLRRYRCR
jgi:branched-chain amino acid transport system ATP-binding protein